MRTYRGSAIAVGVLFILCSATSILSIVPLGGPLVAPVDLAKLAASDTRVVLTALIEFVWALTGAGIAIGLYPVIKRFNPALALGSVAGRLVEAPRSSTAATALTLGEQFVNLKGIWAYDKSWSITGGWFEITLTSISANGPSLPKRSVAMARRVVEPAAGSRMLIR